MNIGGLASGLDTNNIISELMQVERIPIDQLEARKAGYQAKDAAWQQISSRFAAIRTALDAVKDASDLSGFVSAASSDESVATVSVTGNAQPGTSTFTVDALAAAHQVVSTTDFSSADALVGAGDFTLTVGGVDTTITTDATTTLAELAQQINAADVGVSAAVLQVDSTTFKLSLTSTDTGAAAQFATSSTITTLGSTTVVQQAGDAQITIGSGAGALTLSRSSNTITDLVPGVSIELKGTSAAPITISVDRDTAAAADAIQALVDEVNTTLTTLGSYMDYDADTDQAGALLGDSTARSLVDQLRSSISGTILSGEAYPTASSIGITINRDGTFDVDSTKLQDALDTDFDAVVDLLVRSGSATDGRVTFVSSTSGTISSTYAVQITQAATAPSATSSIYAAPAADSTFQITVGSTTVDVSVATGDPIATTVANINAALTAAGVTTLTASAIVNAGNDYLQLDHTSYGSGATFTVTGDPFGLAGTYTGIDVAGTIGGQAATGSGRYLTADAGDPSGLKLSISATAADVSGAGGTLDLGTVTYSEGVFGALDAVVDEAEGTFGAIARAQDRWQSQIDLIDDRIADMEDRLDRKEALLVKQFSALETAMAQLTAQANWLASQLGSLAGGS